jgi:hypothetical protein
MINDLSKRDVHAKINKRAEMAAITQQLKRDNRYRIPKWGEDEYHRIQFVRMYEDPKTKITLDVEGLL